MFPHMAELQGWQRMDPGSLAGGGVWFLAGTSAMVCWVCALIEVFCLCVIGWRVGLALVRKLCLDVSLGALRVQGFIRECRGTAAAAVVEHNHCMQAPPCAARTGYYQLTAVSACCAYYDVAWHVSLCNGVNH
jgi:transposase InsO family protein